ncbi:hypothetical protein KQI77_12240 [Clostridium sp. MSJ-8]|uniref:hypothetical protein n=1 Tax=Clostridium sp. MSJ-8 TaxID=2841510 RepID=UPI001C0EF7BF|nr:hypothetical protein [Clostridium sp. MSJ-8]MBU5488896.1 hypothetical protein [Clostridium sp. MSJ-8]
MKITGSMNYVKVDLKNAYVIKVEEETFVGKKFVVYMETMKTWCKLFLNKTCYVST